MKTIFRNFISVIRRFRMATILNVLGLSIAFAAFMVIMMEVNYNRSFDGHHPGADRIFRVEVGNGEDNSWYSVLPRPLMEAFIKSSAYIEGGTYMNMPFDIYFSAGEDGGKRVFLERAIEVSTGYPGVFTFDMIEGEASSLTKPDNVLIPQSIADKVFGEGETGITGRRIEGSEMSHTVGGVYRDFPPNSSVINAIYIPIPETQNASNWGNWNYVAYVRLSEADKADGIPASFKENFDTSSLGSGYRESVDGLSIRLTSLRETHFVTGVGFDTVKKSSRRTLTILSGIAVVIVLIAAINYMNFSAALAPKRIRSINTQKVLGGSTATIRLALLIEAAIISFASFLIGLLLVYIASGTSLRNIVEADMSPAVNIRLAVITGILSIATGIGAGLYPSLYMTSFQPAMVLKGSFGLSPSGRRLRNVLIGIQFIASFALITSASCMYLQSSYLHNTHLGYDKDNMIVARINSTVNDSREAFSDAIRGYAGVEGITYSQFTLSSADSYMTWGRKYHDKDISYTCVPVTPDFLDVMGIPVTEGRNLRSEDALTRYGAYVFNGKARDMYDLKIGDNIDSALIAGFMPDIKFASLRTEVAPMAFYVWGTENWGQTPSNAYIRVAAGSDMRAAIDHVRATLRSFDSEYPFNVRFFDDVLSVTYEKEDGLSTLITLFSLLAIVISIVGVFGIVVFESEYRRREISLRKVFGSTTGQILVMFNKTYIRILIICFVIASPVSWYAISLWLTNFAYRAPLNPLVWAASLAIVGTLTIAVVTIQTRSAALANPSDALKTE
ncbi:MAG: ABC transporter permease [Tannerellaceae bacterium]|jgi:putative ABC transport system permease protein|nr:ABC transporter permease [Tannerellaceae bacterium]